jgi:hypothetical protein
MSHYPPVRKMIDFEKVKCGDFITGTISNIEYEDDHRFKGFEGKEDRISEAVRLVFTLDGYEYPHRSRWMSFSLGEKSNLYKKYVAKLVNNAKPDMHFDLDALLNMKVKTIWEENGDFTNLDSIYPNGKKLEVDATAPDEHPSADDDFPVEHETFEDDEIPL